jgi:hypothetical protein
MPGQTSDDDSKLDKSPVNNKQHLDDNQHQQHQQQQHLPPQPPQQHQQQQQWNAAAPNINNYGGGFEH